MSEVTFGQKVAEYRALRGMSQRELGDLVRRSESWVSQVERDKIPVDRESVKQALADALGIRLAELTGQDLDQRRDDRRDDVLGRLRLALTGHPALGALFGRDGGEPRSTTDLRHEVDRAWELTHASRFDELSTLLVPLLPELEFAARHERGRRRHGYARLLTSAYQAASAAFARQDEPDAAWVAADRAVRWAEEAGDPLGVIASQFRMAHAFISLQRLDQAEHVAAESIASLRPSAERFECEEPTLSLYGAMHLILAVVGAREGGRLETQQAIEAARKIASRIGVDRNDYNTEFGATNVELHAVSTSVDLGDAGEALEVAGRIDASRLSPERQGRFAIDLARAHAQRRHFGEAVAALLHAEQLAPEQVQTHIHAREVVGDLMNLAGRRPTQELIDLARRIGL